MSEEESSEAHDGRWTPLRVLIQAIRGSVAYERRHGGGVSWSGNREVWERDIAERYSLAQRAVVESYVRGDGKACEFADLTGLLYQWFVFERVFSYASRLPAGLAILERDGRGQSTNRWQG